MKTIYPPKPPKDFNDWIQHIKKLNDESKRHTAESKSK